MDKQEVLDKLGERIKEVGGVEEISEADKEKLKWVSSVVKLFSEEEVLKLTKLTDYLDSNPSRIDGETISAVKAEVENAVRQNSRSIENEVIEYMNKRTKTVMVIFLVVIAAFAVAALVLTGINLGYGDDFWYGWCGKLASAFGTLDFALGALGFMWERIDDMKKKQIRSAGEEVKETCDFEKFLSVIIKNGSTSNIQIQDGGENNTQISKTDESGLQYQKGGRSNKQIKG